MTREGWVTRATRRELREVRRETTSAGLAALALAKRIDNPEKETGSSFAAVVREHRRTLADALRNAAANQDPVEQVVDEVKRKRDQRTRRRPG